MEEKNNDLSKEFKIEMPLDDNQNQDDIDIENSIVNELEKNCMNIYIDKLEIKNEYTDEELINKKTKKEIVEYKNDQILKLKAYISSLEQEKDDLIENFRETTNLLIEKIKDLESGGSKIEKIEILENKDNNKDNNIEINTDNNIIIKDNKINDYYKNLPKDFNKIERPQTATIAEQLNNPKKNSNKIQRCPNCQKEILASEFLAHSLICIRHTFRCKKCWELINEKDKKKHLETYRNPTKIYNCIKDNKFDEFKMILEHGLKSDDVVEQKTGDHIYHSICRFNRILFLKEIVNRKFPLDINLINKNKETPLVVAIDNKSVECAEFIIKFGCDINIKNKGDLSPLMLTAKIGNKKIFELLLNKGANINEKNILGETPLSLAQSHHHEQLALFILQRSKLKFK